MISNVFARLGCPFVGTGVGVGVGTWLAKMKQNRRPKELNLPCWGRCQQNWPSFIHLHRINTNRYKYTIAPPACRFSPFSRGVRVRRFSRFGRRVVRGSGEHLRPAMGAARPRPSCGRPETVRDKNKGPLQSPRGH